MLYLVAHDLNPAILKTEAEHMKVIGLPWLQSEFMPTEATL